MDAEKLRAIQFYTGRKQSSMEAELEDCVNKIYEILITHDEKGPGDGIAVYLPVGREAGQLALLVADQCRVGIGGDHEEGNRQRPGGC